MPESTLGRGGQRMPTSAPGARAEPTPQHPLGVMPGTPTARRGRVKRRPIGARELSQLALNPDCDTLAALVLTGQDQSSTMKDVLGEAVQPDGSHLPDRAGLSFERALTRNAYEGVVAMFRAAGLIAPNAPPPVDLRAVFPDNDPVSLDAREQRTLMLMTRMIAGDLDAPAVIGHPRIRLTVGDRVVFIEPDAIVRRPDGRLVPLEIKSTVDRDARTNLTSYSRTRLQMAVEWLATESVVTMLGGAMGPPGESVLLLRKRGSRKATYRITDVAAEVDRMRRVLAEAPVRAAAAVGALPAGESLETPAGLLSVPTAFSEQCHLHCRLAARCEREARVRGDLATLGTAFAEAMAPAQTLPRLIAVLEGEAAPTTDAERDVRDSLLLVTRMLEAEHLLPRRDAPPAPPPLTPTVIAAAPTTAPAWSASGKEVRRAG